MRTVMTGRTYKREGRDISQADVPLVDEIARRPAEAVAVVDIYPEDRLKQWVVSRESGLDMLHWVVNVQTPRTTNLAESQPQYMR